MFSWTYVIVRVEKAPVTEDEVQHWIRVAIRESRVAPERVVHLSPIVFTARNLAVAVVIGLATRIGQALYLVSLCMLYETEIRIGVPPRRVIVSAERVQSAPKPVLEMKLLVASFFSFD